MDRERNSDREKKSITQKERLISMSRCIVTICFAVWTFCANLLFYLSVFPPVFCRTCIFLADLLLVDSYPCNCLLCYVWLCGSALCLAASLHVALLLLLPLLELLDRSLWLRTSAPPSDVFVCLDGPSPVLDFRLSHLPLSLVLGCFSKLLKLTILAFGSLPLCPLALLLQNLTEQLGANGTGLFL